jgi:hypothetical protein
MAGTVRPPPADATPPPNSVQTVALATAFSPRFQSGPPLAHTIGVIDLSAARRQYGLVALDQVRAAGRSRSSWHRAHRAGLLVPVHPGVSRLAAVGPSPEQAVLAAVLVTGGAASHLSAAWLWGADVPGVDPVDVTVTDRHRSARLAGVRVHRPTDVADLGPVERHGIPVTSPLRTALDVGAVAPPAAVALVVECFVAQRYVTLDALRAGVERHARRGRRGLGPLRLVLAGAALRGLRLEHQHPVAEPAAVGARRGELARAGVGQW